MHSYVRHIKYTYTITLMKRTQESKEKKKYIKFQCIEHYLMVAWKDNQLNPAGAKGHCERNMGHFVVECSTRRLV